MSERTQQLHDLCQHAAKKGRIVIIGHDRADVDSVSSCVLMGRLLERWGISCSIALHEPDQIYRVGTRIVAQDPTTLHGRQLFAAERFGAHKLQKIFFCTPT